MTEEPAERLRRVRRFLELEPGHPKGVETLKKTLLELGIELTRQGEKARARPLLRELVELDPENERAWLWIASSAGGPDEASTALRRVLELHPRHEQALELLRRLEQGGPGRAPWHCPLCEQPAAAAQARCPRCKAVLELRDLGRVLENPELDEKLVHESVIRLKNRHEGDLGFEFQHALAVAYLNLRQLDEAQRHLELAGRLRPEDASLRVTMDEVQRRRSGGRVDSRAQPTGSAARRTILAVDDSPTVQKLVSVTLERRGYRVLVAANGMEALSILNAALPDLVLLDINLPQMDGYQLCRLIKARDSTRDVTVVMLSGKDGFFDKVRGRLAGAAEYLTKPFNPEVLVQVVEKHCRPLARDSDAR